MEPNFNDKASQKNKKDKREKKSTMTFNSSGRKQ